MSLSRIVWRLAIAAVLVSAILGVMQFSGDRQLMLAAASPAPVVVEVLQFRVPAAEREAFVVKDKKVWTRALQQQPGFLHKSVWYPPHDPGRVKFVIYWASREQWKAFPPDLQAQLDRQMQPTNAVLEQSEEYVVNSPPNFSSPVGQQRKL